MTWFESPYPHGDSLLVTLQHQNFCLSSLPGPGHHTVRVDAHTVTVCLLDKDGVGGQRAKRLHQEEEPSLRLRLILAPAIGTN